VITAAILSNCLRLLLRLHHQLRLLRLHHHYLLLLRPRHFLRLLLRLLPFSSSCVLGRRLDLLLLPSRAILPLFLSQSLPNFVIYS
jgi:hypothetical protein